MDFDLETDGRPALARAAADRDPDPAVCSVREAREIGKRLADLFVAPLHRSGRPGLTRHDPTGTT
ncbi:hypothetical protein ACIRP0_06535 [Streptomyces sp. NPDC101733]|uniref:hypothetical protein n=1 Tax=unclassified Streptomyces TaxID=2593676 RepID=UPI0037FA5BAD